MTALLQEPPVATPQTAGKPHGNVLWRVVPWAVPFVAAVIVLLKYDTPAGQIAIYGLYFALAVVLPGTLVMRALYGSRGNWPEDLGVGAAAGLVVQLIGWALAAATGVELLLPIWIGLVVLAFLAVPKLWRHWRVSNPDPLPLAWSWGMAAVLLIVVLYGASNLRGTPLPPATFQIYQDIYYHLALVHEMMRTMPFHVPQVDGEILRYHYLSDSDIASASMLTGIDPVMVYLRLWIIPIIAVGAMVFAVMARSVSGKWWTGPVAAAVGFGGRALTLNGPIAPFGGGNPFSILSPSQTYVIPLFGLFGLICVEALRGKQLRWMWAALPVLAVAVAGSKSSALPPLFAGVGLAALVLLVRRRAMPWIAAGLLGSILFGVVVGLKLFAGGGAGTLALQPLATLRFMDPYERTLGTHDGILLGGFLPPGVANADGKGVLFIVFLLVWWVLAQLPRLLGLFVPLRNRAEGERGQDVAYWMIGGVVVAGTAALWLFWHPSASQGYFFNGILPFAAVLTVCALADHAERFRLAAAGAAAAAAVGVLLLPKTPWPAKNTFVDWGQALGAPFLIAAGAVVLLSAIALAVWRKRALLALPAALIAAVLGASLATGGDNLVTALDNPIPPVKEANAITDAEMRAALWLNDNAGQDDLVATNVHCFPIKSKNACNSRAFWIAGLGGRRTLIESWGYSDSAVAAHGVNGLPYSFQPAPDLAAFDLNERVFAQGAAADVQKLRDTYGVKWLFADTRAAPVAPALAQAADVRYRDGSATVYEIRPGA
ncbi:hypothetical protein AB0J83_17785 [Actinoplanes sp. NPDC049596]|uniref:hypothetical protein n=1 Tax=unclassified Actinoplanes TaxID=2626549 RepID=UPI00344A15ED